MNNEVPKADRGPRINDQIRVKEVRAIDDAGQQLGIIPTREAIRLATEKGLDLVEVQPNTKPPVCKIMDFGKFKFLQKKAAAEAKKKQKTVEVKEIRLGPNIGENDFQTKVNHIKDFLADGSKVLVSVYFSGRELSHTDLGQVVLNRVIDILKAEAIVESHSKMEGRNLMMTLAPVKK